MNMMLAADFYKTGHADQYPEGMTRVFSNMTPRSSRLHGVDHVVVFGIQYFIEEYLVNRFRRDFFALPEQLAVEGFREVLATGIGRNDVSRVRDLHKLGYLPIEIRALPEGSLCPIGVPFLTIDSTHPDFGWVTNYIETIMSTTLWGPMTSATIAMRFRRLLDRYAAETSDMPEFVDYQGHDFSMRGMFGLEAAMMSGAGHLLSFKGTDTIPALDFLRRYYRTHLLDIGGSIPATEHSVMCMGGKDNERETIKRLITEVYPSGPVSIVCDTWDYWNVIDNILPSLKDEIMRRDGCLVVRPDSGDPREIIPVTVDKLAQTFGADKNSKGYHQLNPHVGLIYGDGITWDVAHYCLWSLRELGLASTNVVFGLGSYTYQMNSRDTFGMAVKATYGEVKGEGRAIFKAPKTDSSKTSAKGLLRVVGKSPDYKLEQECGFAGRDAMGRVFRNGVTRHDFPFTLPEIRHRLRESVAALEGR